jgi:TatD DNase family protein
VYVDSHCHLDLPLFDADRELVVGRAVAAGVEGIVIPAIRPSTFSFLRELAARYPSVVKLAFGIHPQVVPDLTPAELAAVDRLGEELDGAVAVGECGLDGATGDHEAQERLFRRQIAVARERRLPLLVHVLRAHDRAPAILAEERAGEVGGVMHSYSGPADMVKVYADLGFCFSFAGPVTYKNARKPLEAARAVPDHLLLVETDAPDQAPVPHRGGRSEPAFIAPIAEALAAARGVTAFELAATMRANTRRVLGF